MKIGICPCILTPIATPELIRDITTWAEDISLDSIWLTEHVMLFEYNTIPYQSSNGQILPKGMGYLDTLTVFAFMAAMTKKIRFGTGVALLPQRNPIYTAKELVTLDWLTHGRIDFGVGVGWNKEEIESCGYTFNDRGTRCDEFLILMKKLWTESVVNFKGKWLKFEGARLDPKPIQKPHIPILIGGYTHAAFRRAVRFGQGWYGYNMTPKKLHEMINGINNTFNMMNKSKPKDFQIIVSPQNTLVSDEDITKYSDLGVNRLILKMDVHNRQDVMKKMYDVEKMIQMVKWI